MDMKYVEHTLERLRLATEESNVLSQILRREKECGHKRPGLTYCDDEPEIVFHREAYCYECAKHELTHD